MENGPWSRPPTRPKGSLQVPNFAKFLAFFVPITDNVVFPTQDADNMAIRTPNPLCNPVIGIRGHYMRLCMSDPLI